MARVISIVSGKGGVGKTTTTANLGAALVERNKKTVVVDANLTTPNLSLHLGIPLYPITLHDVLKRRAHISEAMYIHPSGIRVVPASLSVDALRGLNASKLAKALDDLLDTEIILIDGAAGLGKEAIAAVEAADEVLIVTNPELPAVTDALKAIRIAEKTGAKILGVVINRVRGHKYELSYEEIQSILEYPVLGSVPEDLEVAKAISMKMPVVHHSPRSKASHEFKRIAAGIVGEVYKEPRTKGWIEVFFKWLG